MNKTVWKILKDIGMLRFFILILFLRLPFDFLNGVISANMLESFIRLAEKGQSENLLKTFGTFLLFTVLLFGYNVTIWAAVSVKADMLLQKRLRNSSRYSKFWKYRRTTSSRDYVPNGSWWRGAPS